MISRKSTQLMDVFRNKCAAQGLRITPQRVAIYGELLKAKDHPSADAVYKKVRRALPNVSFDTVYRTLLSFSRIGLLNVVEGYGEKKRFDPDVHSHHHCRCIKCHAIIDFHSDAYDALPVPRGLKRQFTVLNKRVVLEGLCRKCARAG